MEYKVKRIRNTYAQEVVTERVTILCSYGVPVAARYHADNDDVIRTETRWSRRTERHITEWCIPTDRVSQAFLDEELEEIIGDKRLHDPRRLKNPNVRPNRSKYDYKPYEEGDAGLVIPPNRWR